MADFTRWLETILRRVGFRCVVGLPPALAVVAAAAVVEREQQQQQLKQPRVEDMRDVWRKGALSKSGEKLFG